MIFKDRAVFLVAMLMATGVRADVFGTGLNQFSIDFVEIGYKGNAAQSALNRAHSDSGGDGYGAVGYNFQMGKYEITIDQFTKARTLDSRIGDGDEGYWNSGDGVSTPQVGTSAPASYVSVYEAMKFANWLTTGNAYIGAYQFDGTGTLVAVDRTGAATAYGTVYVLPSEDEWHKAAYYKLDNSGVYTLYANGLDTAPAIGGSSGWNYYAVNSSPNRVWETGSGAEEQNGTYDMMGNVWEWTESAEDGTFNSMTENLIYRGGAWNTTEGGLDSASRRGATSESNVRGFRVAAIPEPSSALLLMFGSGGLIFYRRSVQSQKEHTLNRHQFD